MIEDGRPAGDLGGAGDLGDFGGDFGFLPAFSGDAGALPPSAPPFDLDEASTSTSMSSAHCEPESAAPAMSALFSRASVSQREGLAFGACLYVGALQENTTGLCACMRKKMRARDG